MTPRTASLRTGLMTSAALVCFAANSILTRLALRGGAIDAAGFTLVRLLSGALVLGLIVRARPARASSRGDGGWPSALALFLYAAPFSFAYLELDAGAGALILFGCVQATMIGWGMARGERLSWRELAGLVLALAGLVALTRPGGGLPSLGSSLLMALAGVAWGAYSLRGRAVSAPLVVTARAFWRSLPLALLLALGAMERLHATPRGLVLAALSGGLASGVGYAIWYRALADLKATRAALVQLAVPVIAAAGGVLLLGETLSVTLALSGVAVLAGVGLAVMGRSHGRRS